MQTKVNIDLLIEASKSNLVDFKCLPDSPVILEIYNSSFKGSMVEIVNRYTRNGFSIVQINSNIVTENTVSDLANFLNLGSPFVPPLYMKGEYRASPISKISTQYSSEAHPTFQREVGVKLHCDGTLQKIGHIKTSILLCETPSTDGGNSVLFNATAAYAELLQSDLDAAIAMATPGSLIRQANMNGCNEKNEGPVFSVENKTLISAYSVTETDKFLAPVGVNASALNRGIEFMHKASQCGSPYYHEVHLEANQAIIFANSRISHGRTPYKNSGLTRRCLYRGLFLNYPTY